MSSCAIADHYGSTISIFPLLVGFQNLSWTAQTLKVAMTFKDSKIFVRFFNILRSSLYLCGSKAFLRQLWGAIKNIEVGDIINLIF
jgi:hypothetical protein